MKTHWSQILLFFLGAALFLGCFEPPDLGDTPRIGFNSLRFIEGGTTSSDSMVLKFDFEDGDGNIGLTDQDFFYPFHNFFSVIDSNDTLVTFSNTVEPPFYIVDPFGLIDPILFSEDDNRPSVYTPCDYYYNPDFSADTFYIFQNEYRNNFHVEFLKRKNGQYSLIYFDTQFPDCETIGFNGTIPIYDRDYVGQSLSGTITYAMHSNFFKFKLTPDTFKIRFYIYDRDLNQSNIVESPEFLFEDIVAN